MQAPRKAGRTPSRDALRQHQPLDVFFVPHNVALIGATDRVGSVGRTLMTNLLASSLGGNVFPVNPYQATVLGQPAYASIAAVPAPVELAVIATPAPTVPDIIGECVAAGVKGAIIISAGFRERGPDGLALEQQALEQARRGKLRVIGPNCLGVMCPLSGLNATFASSSARPGNVAFISQSGALYTAVLDWSMRERIGFSYFISLGSMMDVGWADLINYLGDDPHTRSILIYMETIGDVRAFISAAREVALSKPIIVLKGGRSSGGAQAAAAHTGAMTGEDLVLDAAFRRCGVLRINTIANLFSIAEVLAKQPRPAGPRLTIVTNAGGPGVLAADTLSSSGGELAALPPETFDALNRVLPAHWSHGNPIDILGDAGPERYGQTLEIAAQNKQSDGLLVILTPQAMTEPTQVAERLHAFAKQYRKPLLASWMGGDEVAPGKGILTNAGIPTFAYPDSAAFAFQVMWRYSENLRSLYETPTLDADGADLADRVVAEQIVQAARDAGRRVLNCDEARDVLAAYGIPSTDTFDPNSYELLLSARLDRQLGPVLRFGKGGPLADVMGDLACGLPPLNTTLARRVIEHTRIYTALSGRSGYEAVDLGELERVLVRFSQLVAEQRWIKEIVINPLCAQADRIAAYTSTITLHDPALRAEDLPRLAIRPYPTQYVQPWTLKNGATVLIRPIRPEDEPLMVAFHRTLSEQSVYLRYFYPMKLSQRISHERLVRNCFIDYDRSMALVADWEDPYTAQHAILGVGRLNKVRATDTAEFAVIVSDEWHGRGLGGELLRRLITIARTEQISMIVGHILPDNRGMQRLARKFDFTLRPGGDGLIRAELPLSG